MGKKKTRFQWEREPAEVDEETEERPSRRALKREDNRRKETVKELLELGPEHWKALPMSEDLREALKEARRLMNMVGAREGQRRQIQRVATILRQDDHEAITEALKKH